MMGLEEAKNQNRRKLSSINGGRNHEYKNACGQCNSLSWGDGIHLLLA